MLIDVTAPRVSLGAHEFAFYYSSIPNVAMLPIDGRRWRTYSPICLFAYLHSDSAPGVRPVYLSEHLRRFPHRRRYILETETKHKHLIVFAGITEV